VSERILKVEELESIRLKDYLQLSQEEAAQRMGVSQPTFHRIITEAHQKVAEAFIEGKAIRVEGGHYLIREETNAPVSSSNVPPGWQGGRKGRERGQFTSSKY
jgi:predicted DNA-binding protein (UPF0251 family)